MNRKTQLAVDVEGGLRSRHQQAGVWVGQAGSQSGLTAWFVGRQLGWVARIGRPACL